MRPLYTVGYEGLTIEAFLGLLCEHQIERVIDVRRNPISRKQGFSKNPLSNMLSQQGIAYTHIVALGTPKILRDALKEDSNYNSFFEGVKNYLQDQEEALQAALDLALSQNCTLLCFERNYSECHRSVVAVELERRSNMHLTIEHIKL